MFKVVVVLWIVITGALTFASLSEAATSLSKDRADNAAAKYMAEYQTGWNDFYDPDMPTGWVPSDEPDSLEYNAYIKSYELDSCDVVGRKAECDTTIFWSDGDACDMAVYIRTTRRNKLSLTNDEMVCDSGETPGY